MDLNFLESKLSAEPKILEIRDPNLNQVSSDDDSDSDSDSVVFSNEDDRFLKESDSAIDYWTIRKLIKYIKFCNETATLDSLVALLEFDLSQEINQKAIVDSGGLEILINLTEVSDIRCKLNSLKVLNGLTNESKFFRKQCSISGLTDILVRFLSQPFRDLQEAACKVLANIANIAYTRKVIKSIGGVEKLIDLIDIGLVKKSKTKVVNKEVVDVCRAAVRSLWNLSENSKIVDIMNRSGSIQALTALLKLQDEEILIATLGTLRNCSICESFRLAIANDGIMESIMKLLKDKNNKNNTKLHIQGCSVIEQCAAAKTCQDLLRKSDFLQFLIKLLRNELNRANIAEICNDVSHRNTNLLVPLIGSIWKCSMSDENKKIFSEAQTLSYLVTFLIFRDISILINVTGALYELVKDHTGNRVFLMKNQAIGKIVKLLTEQNRDLLKNIVLLLKECAENSELAKEIDRLDGIRLIWSLLKNNDPEIQAVAALALVPCLRNANNSGALARSFVGGLELVVKRLHSGDEAVLAAICSLISEIANDHENLGIISDHGVVKLLANLVRTSDLNLREQLSTAIAKCCNWKNNNEQFGELEIIPTLVTYLKKSHKTIDNFNVRKSVTFALSALSENPINCVILHETKTAVALLLKMTACCRDNQNVQKAIANCLRNIRTLALNTESYAYSLHTKKP